MTDLLRDATRLPQEQKLCVRQ